VTGHLTIAGVDGDLSIRAGHLHGCSDKGRGNRVPGRSDPDGGETIDLAELSPTKGGLREGRGLRSSRSVRRRWAGTQAISECTRPFTSAHHASAAALACSSEDHVPAGTTRSLLA
jgi:hypothetical protein